MPFISGSATLVSLRFVSRPAESLSPAALGLIVRQAWAHNARAGITGEIVLRDGMFHQTLEGDFSDLVPLASRILSDPRHHQISIECFCAIPARTHETWQSSGFGTLPPTAVPTGASSRVIRLLPAVAKVADMARNELDRLAVPARTY